MDKSSDNIHMIYDVNLCEVFLENYIEKIWEIYSIKLPRGDICMVKYLRESGGL